MTRFPHDQFTKHCFEPLLSPIGQFTPAFKISAKVREVDIYFQPFPQASPPADLGLLYRCVTRATLFELFRNPITPHEICACASKLFELHNDIQPIADNNLMIEGNIHGKDMDFWKQVLTLAETTTQRVGERLLQDVGHATAQTKADGSLVTQSDQWADAEIKKTILATFPDHAVLSEEDFHLFTDTPWTWVIDPIDGTTNFAMGLPLWGIAIGLLYHGYPVFGHVYFPPVNQRFHGFWAGESGLDLPQGAWLNGQPIHTSNAALTKNHLFGICARSLGVTKTRLPAKLRMIGVTTYSFLAVAAGFLLGGVEATPKIWDLAAVWPILHGAGGTWISLSADRIFPAEVGKNYGGHPLPSLVLARSELAAEFEAPIRAGLGAS